ncbi:uridine kinase [Legionella sp. km772]|uniref:uridine kinase family protein n=1 Tax=Legionella sp. km772 TaxID=2498111 RepID=UPI000F8D08B5|nr:uridine kinase [Legionella sp. km772]RUR12877.1 uridine kinase [Legionella sp. km772]
MFFVFIGGASASGKTGVSEHLLKKLNDKGIKTQKLNMDDYYKERPDTVSNEVFRATTNFDVPEMLHLDLFQEHVAALGRGEKISKPLFSFLTNKRSGEEEVNPSEVVIVEGIFAQLFYQQHMAADFPALNVNVSTDSLNDIVERRIARDIASRGRSREDVIAQEQRYVGPGFFKYTACYAAGSDLYINNQKHTEPEAQSKELDRVADEIAAAVVKRKSELSVASSAFARSRRPDVRALVAASHFKAGHCTANKFTGYFNGVFGGVAGDYEEVFPQEEDALSEEEGWSISISCAVQ